MYFIISTLGSKQKALVSNIDLFYNFKKGGLKSLSLPAPTLNRLTGMITCRYGQIIVFDRSLFEMGSAFKLIIMNLMQVQIRFFMRLN